MSVLLSSDSLIGSGGDFSPFKPGDGAQYGRHAREGASVGNRHAFNEIIIPSCTKCSGIISDRALGETWFRKKRVPFSLYSVPLALLNT